MGKGGVSQQEAFSPLDYLEELCAYAISVGMPASEYWYGDPQLLNNYVRAEEIRQRKKNNELWLQGLYIYQAIGALSPVLNPFSKKHKAERYMSKPIPITSDELAEAEKEKYDRSVDYMHSLVKKTEVGKK